MPIPVTCQCGQKFSAPDKLAGKRVKCPKCGSALAIPHPPAPAAPPAAALGGSPGGMDDLLADVGISQEQQKPRCPSCGAEVQAGAVICVSCGFNSQTGEKIAGVEIEPGEVDLSKLSAAEQQMHMAEQEILKNPISQDDVDFGDAQSIWAYVLTICLPLLFALAAGVIILWGGGLGDMSDRIFAAFDKSKWGLVTFYSVAALGVMVTMSGWFRLTMIALDDDIWHGLLSLILVGTYSFYYGVFHWMECRIYTIVLIVGWWISSAAVYTLLGVSYVRADNYLLMVFMILMYIGQVVSFIGAFRICLVAAEEDFTKGLLCLLVPFYVLAYGFMDWWRCKTDLIIFFVGFGVYLLGFIVWLAVGLSGSTPLVDFDIFQEAFSELEKQGN